MTINATGRHPRVQELCAELSADQKWTGRRRAVGQILENFVSNLLKSVDDSTELIDALSSLVEARNKVVIAIVNPHKPSDTAVAVNARKAIGLGGGSQTTVNTLSPKS